MMSARNAGSADAASLIARLRAAREVWVSLPAAADGTHRAVKFRRPAEAEVLALITTSAGGRRQLAVQLPTVQACAVDWRGVTEADLLGDTVGSSDAVPFDAGVWAEVVADRLDWLQPCCQGLLDAISAHMARQDDDAKNSPATSTPGPAPAP